MAQPETAIEIDGTSMIHDCAITEHHLVLFLCPFRFDIAAAMRGQSVLAWEPQRGTRIAVVRCDGSAGRWSGAEPFWIWHFANAFEDGTDRSIVDLCRWEQPVLGGSELAPRGSVQRATLPANSLHMRPDLGRMCKELTDWTAARCASTRSTIASASSHAWMTACSVDGTTASTSRASIPINHRRSRDVEHPRAARCRHRPQGRPARRVGLFRRSRLRAPPRQRRRGRRLRHGLRVRHGDAQSTFVILDAADRAGEPVATPRLPQRVPFGLHGAWLPT